VAVAGMRDGRSASSIRDAPSISESSGVQFQGGARGAGFVYDLTKGVVVPVSMPNSTFYFLTAPSPVN
jgi:hypothetical protein